VSAWVSFINELPFKGPIYIVGGSGDKLIGEEIIKQHVAAAKSAGVVAKNLMNIAGQLNFLASAALQQKAVLNYVNDSAPLHFCSAVDAPVVAIYCSTIPAFGFGPLSSSSFVVETSQTLTCRPCGLHGKKDCPLGHFNCAHSIQNAQLIAPLLQVTQH
jgi:heptosyltransferase-2